MTCDPLRYKRRATDYQEWSEEGWFVWGKSNLSLGTYLEKLSKSKKVVVTQLVVKLDANILGVVLDTTSEGPHSLFVQIETCLSK